MRTRTAIVWIAVVAVLAGTSGAAAATRTRSGAGPCPAPVVRLADVARVDGDAGAPLPAGPAAQDLAVAVPRGPREVLNAPSSVTLRRKGRRSLDGDVRHVVAVDATGDAAGWTLSASFAGAADVRVCVREVVATAETTRGLRVERDAAPRDGEPAQLLHADPGFGQGAFDVTFSVASDGRATRTDRLVLPMRVALSPARRVSSTATG